MEDKKRVNIRDSIKRTYHIRDRRLVPTGKLDWPLYLGIERVVRSKKKTFQVITEEALLKRSAPAAVLVDQSGNMLYIYGHAGLYLEPAQGYAGNNNILKMAQNRFRRDLSIALRKAVTKQETIDSPEFPVKKNGMTLWVQLSVIPITKKTIVDQAKNLYLIIFNHKNEQTIKETKIIPSKETISDPQISKDMDSLHQMIISKELELDQITGELEKAKAELEIARNKLHLVKENIFTSETELETINVKTALAKDELLCLNKELSEVKNGLEATLLIPEKVTEELTPIRQELEIIKNELSTANQELNTKKEELEKMNQQFEIPTNEMPLLSREAILSTETEPDMFQVNVSDSENSNFSFNNDPFSADLHSSDLNDKGMGFISKNEPKLFSPARKGFAFGHESDSSYSSEIKKELKFKDVLEFQAAASYGFRHDSEIVSVVIPEGVEVIKRSMFYKCNLLEEVSFPSTLKIIEDFAFYGCEKLNKVALEKCRFLETIGTSAFEGCIAFAELTIPDSVIEIEEASFLGCKGIEAVTFQDNSQLEILGSHVFKDCVRLSKIFLPDQLKHIGVGCFYGCKNLSSIHLSRDLQTVGEYAFWGCDSLRQIEIVNKKILKQPGFTVGLPEVIKL